MDYLEPFPLIRSLGAARLQALADEWVETPVAKECMIGRLVIKPDVAGFAEIVIGIVPGTRPGDIVHMPADHFLRFVIDREFRDPERSRLRDALSEWRAWAGPEPFQRYHSNVAF